jgi:hypothetical protein
VPRRPTPCHWSMGWPPHCFSSVDPWQFDPRCKLSCHRFTGPLSVTWGAKPTSKPPFWPWQPTYLPCNRLQGPTIIFGWQGGGMDDWPMPLSVTRWPSYPKPPHLYLQVPLCPLHTIKEAMVLGGDHHSAALKHSKCSKALRSSPRVVAS